MGYKDITAGKKTARVIAGRFVTSTKGTLGVEVAFKFQDTVGEEQLNWVGWCTQDAMPNTMKTLVDALGFNGDDEVVPGTSRLKDGVLDVNRDVELVIEMETYEGKTSPRIKWVNQPGGGSAFKALTPEVVKGQLAAAGFKAAFYAQKAGAPKPQPATSYPTVVAAPSAFPQSPIPEEALPF